MGVLDEKEVVDDRNINIPKVNVWSNDDKIELIKLRCQGLTFDEIGIRMSRTKHAARSEYGRIRRGETDVTVSLEKIPELRKLLPFRKTRGASD